MSDAAYQSLGQVQYKPFNYTDIVVPSIPTIEKLGGGSARCMIAEIFLQCKLPAVTGFIFMVSTSCFCLCRNFKVGYYFKYIVINFGIGAIDDYMLSRCNVIQSLDQSTLFKTHLLRKA